MLLENALEGLLFQIFRDFKTFNKRLKFEMNSSIIKGLKV